MIPTRFFALTATLGTLAIGACSKDSSPSGTVCTTLAAAGLGVSVMDSVTGVRAGFTGVTIVARDGVYGDSAFFGEFPTQGRDTVPLAYEHRGTVRVTVRADGYQTWTRTGITITGDQCHVHEEFVTARLVR